MAIGIDVTISPDGAVSGGRVAETSLDKVGKAADNTTRSTMTLRDELNAMAATSYTTSRRQVEYQKTLSGSAAATNQLTKATDSAGNSMRGFQGFVGQAGFQLSDIAIQLGAGANAAMVFGIQGGQLLGFLNPMAGALATVAGILIGQFQGGMYASADATRELDNALTRTNAQINEMSAAQARLAQARIAESLSQDLTELNRTRVELAIATEEVDKFRSRVEEISGSQVIGKGILLGFEELSQSFSDSEENAKKLSDRKEELEDRINSNREALEKYNTVLQGNTLAEENNAKVIERRANTLLSMSENLIVLQTRLAGNNREASIQEAVFRSGAEEGSAYAQQIALLAGQQFDLQRQLRASNTSLKEFDKDGEYIARLQQQVELVGLSAHQQAVLRAEYALSADATDEQIRKARELAGALYDSQESIRSNRKAQNEYNNVLRRFMPDSDAVELRVRAIAQAYDAGALSAKQVSLELAQLNAQMSPEHLTYAESFNLQFQQVTEGARNLQASVGEITGQMFGTLSSQIGQATADMLLFGASGEDAARQVALAVSSQLISSLVELGVQWAINAAMGEAIAAASLAATAASATATATAWATPAALASLATLGTNAAPAAAAMTGTITTANTLAATTAIPGFATGGYVQGPGTGTSDSINARLSMGEFVMPADQTRRYAPELNDMRSGNYREGSSGPVKLNIINQTTGRVDEANAEWVSRNELQVILSEEVPNIVAGEFNDEYSKTNKAYRSAYKASRNL